LDELQETEGALNKDNTGEKIIKVTLPCGKLKKKDEPFWDYKEKINHLMF